MSFRARVSGSGDHEWREVPRVGTSFVCVKTEVPREDSMKNEEFPIYVNQSQWISIRFDKKNQWIPRILYGRPGRVGDQPQKGNRAVVQIAR